MLIAFAPEPFASGGLPAFAWAFAQGVLVDLTPCVYPLIPITVALFGAEGVSRRRALLLASAYVLGMATLYTSLGVLVASTGAAFGAWLGNPWVVVPVAALLVALAASMFGAFDLQLPTSLQGRLTTVGGAGPLGAFLMGLVSGLLSAPCTGPVLLSLLAYIARASADGGSVLYGGSLLFVYALGMGTLFFAVALGASLFRPGPWMEHVKSVFGIALLVMALWFLRPISPWLEGLIIDPNGGLWLGLAAIAVGVAIGAIHLSFKSGGRQLVRKTLGVALAVFGSIVTINQMLYVPELPWHAVRTLDEFEAEVQAARDRNAPVLIDFSAKWCTPCLEMEKVTFHHSSVEPLLANEFHLIRIDVTDPGRDEEVLKDALTSGTLPSVLLFAPAAALVESMAAVRAGQPFPPASTHFKTFVGPSEFLPALQALR